MAMRSLPPGAAGGTADDGAAPVAGLVHLAALGELGLACSRVQVRLHLLVGLDEDRFVALVVGDDLFDHFIELLRVFP